MDIEQQIKQTNFPVKLLTFFSSISDLDVTRERALMRSIHEERESQLSDDSAKENAASHANVSVSQSVPNRSALDSRMMKNGSNQSSVSMSQSQLSQV